eukprot:scaffold11_cov257-Pinguiococcus_pyrenoidosus.AAC.6
MSRSANQAIAFVAVRTSCGKMALRNERRFTAVTNELELQLRTDCLATQCPGKFRASPFESILAHAAHQCRHRTR